jgi:hypothetical protein
MPTMRAAGSERHVDALLDGAAQIAAELHMVRADDDGTRLMSETVAGKEAPD